MRTEWLKNHSEFLKGWQFSLWRCGSVWKAEVWSLSMSQCPFLTLWSLTEHQIVWALFLVQVQSASLAVSDTSPSEHLKCERIASVNDFLLCASAIQMRSRMVLPYGNTQYSHSYRAQQLSQYICPSKILHRGWDSHLTQPCRNLPRLFSKGVIAYLESFSSLILKSYP